MPRGIKDLNPDKGQSEIEKQNSYTWIEENFHVTRTEKEKRILETAIETYKRPPYYLTGGKHGNNKNC